MLSDEQIDRLIEALADTVYEREELFGHGEYCGVYRLHKDEARPLLQDAIKQALDADRASRPSEGQWPPERPIGYYRPEMEKVLIRYNYYDDRAWKPSLVMRVGVPDEYEIRRGRYHGFYLLPGKQEASHARDD